MIIALDTSTPICRLSVYDGKDWVHHEWESGRNLANELLGYVQKTLAGHDVTVKDITGIIAFEGPGSFTGLRIGLTVLNTLASSEHVPIVGVGGEDWIAKGQQRLAGGSDDTLVMPVYGGEPNITTPRK
jgi:tRNA threonylcarbamoyladenosine biosynthesis protein TsaB